MAKKKTVRKKSASKVVATGEKCSGCCGCCKFCGSLFTVNDSNFNLYFTQEAKDVS